ncbi:hypothetical protein BCR34DRAFT_473742 [Clohesyomyces aquaticus]|uniref:TMEM205-like domain-containing protein n=1 Tax=Clohesyomyces aquaticus TaxID=1231657 RepID=A0A1Y2A6P1_9PLEO|nr:hypothetical protein BCR34DRAFT_473742 [Clohesyomyces aquaticus]
MLGPLHLLSYSALLGTELYQTFVVTKITYQELPRPAFTTLQKRLFPLYFKGQAFLVILTAATIPPHGPSSLIGDRRSWIPFAVAGATAALNFLVYGPLTRQVMIDRVHQETRDGRAIGRKDNMSTEMRLLNREFSRTHAMSIHLNLITIGATLWYGWWLATKLDSSAAGAG